MPDGTQTTSPGDAAVETTLSLRGRADTNFDQVAASIKAVHGALKTLQSSKPGDPALDDLLEEVARLTGLYAEGADLFARLSENPSAFRKSARAGLADVWGLRKAWTSLQEQFTSVLAESRSAIRHAGAERRRLLSEARAPLPVPAPASSPRREVDGNWLEFLCMTTRHLAQTARMTRPVFPPVGIGTVSELPRQAPSEQECRTAAARLAASPLFDAAFYVSQFPPDTTPSEPAYHYVTNGWTTGRDPHPFFSTSYYIASSAAPLPAGADPLTHYITTGSAERRNPHPLFDTAFFAAGSIEALPQGDTWLSCFLDGRGCERSPHPIFDPGYYCAQAALRGAGALPALLHYLVRGWRYGIPFSPLFDVDYYRDQLPSGSHVEPWSHYVMRGAAQGLNPHPLFDSRFYLAAFPENEISNPLLHYLFQGEAEGISPSPFFEPVYYRDHYRAGQPVAGSLAHFVSQDAAADHRPIPTFDSKAYRLVFMRETEREHPSTVLRCGYGYFLQRLASTGRTSVRK